jgi:hypothetical protein
MLTEQPHIIGYRQSLLGLKLRLGVLMAGILWMVYGASGIILAQSIDDPLEEPPEFRQPKKTAPANRPAGNAKPPWWHRLVPGQSKRDDDRPVPDEAITQVGPRTFQPKTSPLFRVGKPVVIGEKTLASGIYLALIAPKGATERLLMLQQGGQTVAQVTLHAVVKPDSPVTTLNPKLPVLARLSSQETEDGKGLVMILDEGPKRFESEPFSYEQ